MDIINDFEVQFYKALRLLDLGKTEQVAKILENVVAEAAKMQNNLFFIRASCCLRLVSTTRLGDF